MAQPVGNDQRRERRAPLEASIKLRRMGMDGLGPTEEALTLNISLSGVYFETSQGSAYSPSDVVMASIAIPSEQQREFPFSRLAGRSRVVRIDELLEGKRQGERSGKRQGVALKFSENLTVLSGTQ